ncbi:hypothetical protein AAKU67_001024 [Oxalobacteraceae bacterium GrIS 2.11]
MRSEKPYIDDTIRVIYPDDQPVLVAADIKNDSAILQDTGIAEIRFNSAWRMPVRFQRMPIPGQCLFFCICILWI